MKRPLLFICVILISLFGLAAISVQSAGALEQHTGNASLIIKMVNGLSTEEQNAVIARNGGIEVSSVPALRLIPLNARRPNWTTYFPITSLTPSPKGRV